MYQIFHVYQIKNLYAKHFQNIPKFSILAYMPSKKAKIMTIACLKTGSHQISVKLYNLLRFIIVSEDYTIQSRSAFSQDNKVNLISCAIYFSVFHPTNETFNFWTHAIPGLILTWRFWSFMLENVGDRSYADSLLWPYWFFVFGKCNSKHSIKNMY